MRTNIDIDDDLMVSAMAATGTTTKKAAVEACLRQTVQLKQQAALRALRGLAVWRGHDDDWFASDEEILAKREATESEEGANPRKLRQAKPHTSSERRFR